MLREDKEMAEHWFVNCRHERTDGKRPRVEASCDQDRLAYLFQTSVPASYPQIAFGVLRRTPPAED